MFILFDLLGVAGFGAVLYGVSLWSMPAAFIVGGMVVLWIGVQLAKAVLSASEQSP